MDADKRAVPTPGIVPSQRANSARLTRDLSQPRRYLSFVPWESAEAMGAWKSDPRFPQRMGAGQEHVEEFTPSELEVVAAAYNGAAVFRRSARRSGEVVLVSLPRWRKGPHSG